MCMRWLEHCHARAEPWFRACPPLWAVAGAALGTPRNSHENSSLLIDLRSRRGSAGSYSAAPTTMDAQQIVTNWAAYRASARADHPSHVPNAASWGTGTNVTTFDMGAPADTSGNLINFYTGEQLPVTVAFTRSRAPNDVAINWSRHKYACQILFFHILDLSNVGIVRGWVAARRLPPLLRCNSPTLIPPSDIRSAAPRRAEAITRRVGPLPA